MKIAGSDTDRQVAIMVARLPIVEQLLGAPLSELTREHLAAAVEQRLPEGPDLDFKREHYGTSDKDKEEFAKDVAAFANHVGGLLIIGVGDDNAVASGLSPVELSDSRRRGMLAALRQRLAPFVPEIDVLPVAGDTDAEGFYLIVVGRSLRAPHAVVVGPPNRPLTLWPVREGTGTRYLHESELAEHYRDRFRGATIRYERLTNVISESTALLGIDRGPGAWKTVGLVPGLPGSLPRGVEGIQRLQEIVAEWIDAAWPQGILSRELAAGILGNYAVRVRRAVYNSDAMNDRLPQRAYIECHDDRSVVASVPLRGNRSPIDGTTQLLQARLEGLVLELLHFVTFYARVVRSSGDGYVHVELRHPAGKRIRLAENEIQWATSDAEELGSSIDVEDLILPDLSVELDGLGGYLGLGRTAYLVMQDLVAGLASRMCSC